MAMKNVIPAAFLMGFVMTGVAFGTPAEELRAQRLKKLSETTPVIAFVKRHLVHPSFYAYTEGQSDAQRERHFRPGSKLCLLKVHDRECSVEDLIDDPTGVIRDIDVSYDGKRILFAWKKSATCCIARCASVPPAALGCLARRR